MAGPSSIGVADTYTWNAYAFGGTGTVSYQWKYENVGSSTWNSLGTYAYQQRYVDGSTPDFIMRVRMIAGSDTISRDTLVDVNPITSIDLFGPTWVHAGQVCHWTATPTGGDAPYIYSWVGGSVVDTTSDPDTYGVYVLEHFYVDVTVTAANGSEAYTSQEIFVDESGPGC